MNDNNIKFSFSISPELYQRLKPYITSDRKRHMFAENALIESINRKEGRDKKLQMEKLKKDAAIIQKMIDGGLIKV